MKTPPIDSRVTSSLGPHAAPLGPYGRQLVRRVGAHATGFLAAGLLLFMTFNLLESANADPSLMRAVLGAIGAAMGITDRLAKPALVLGGVTAALSAARTGSLIAWCAAGGSPTALLRGSLVVGAVAAAVLVASGVDHTPPLDANGWLRGPKGPFRVVDVGSDGARIARAEGVEVEDGRIVRRWSAKALSWQEGRWTATDRFDRRFLDDRIETSTGAGPLAALPLVPDDWTALSRDLSSRRRWGLPIHAATLARVRRFAEPLAWCLAPVLGFGLALSFGLRTRGFINLSVGLSAAFAVYLADELAGGLVDAAVVAPTVGGWGPTAMLAAATVAVWRTVGHRGIRDE